MDRFLKGKSHAEVVEDVVNNLGLLAECELAVSAFYKFCAEKSEDDRTFWEGLVKEEIRHAEAIRKMIALIEASPEDFTPGQAFNPAAIRTFRIQMDGLVNDLNDGKIPTDELFSIANGIEDSTVELSFMKIVDTNNSEFKALARHIDVESRNHRNSIKEMAAGRGDP